jgi:hypothetical protein
MTAAAAHGSCCLDTSDDSVTSADSSGVFTFYYYNPGCALLTSAVQWQLQTDEQLCEKFPGLEFEHFEGRIQILCTRARSALVSAHVYRYWKLIELDNYTPTDESVNAFIIL